MNVNKVVVGCNQECMVTQIQCFCYYLYQCFFLSVQWDLDMFNELLYNKALGMTNDITELWDPHFDG